MCVCACYFRGSTTFSAEYLQRGRVDYMGLAYFVKALRFGWSPIMNSNANAKDKIVRIVERYVASCNAGMNVL